MGAHGDIARTRARLDLVGVGAWTMDGCHGWMDEVDVDDSCINRRTCKTIMVGEVVSQRSAVRQLQVRSTAAATVR